MILLNSYLLTRNWLDCYHQSGAFWRKVELCNQVVGALWLDSWGITTGACRQRCIPSTFSSQPVF